MGFITVLRLVLGKDSVTVTMKGFTVVIHPLGGGFAIRGRGAPIVR